MTNRKLWRLAAALLALSLACGAWAETVPANDVQTAIPTEAPSAEPTLEPTETAAAEPTEMPTEEPTEEPAAELSENPTEEPTAAPTIEPTTTPTAELTEAPTADPTDMPTVAPTEIPTVNPTSEPNDAPQDDPLPGEAQEDAIQIAAEGNVQIVDGVSRITLSQPGEGPTVVRLCVSEGETVERGQLPYEVCASEETTVVAPVSGVVTRLFAAPGDELRSDEAIAAIVRSEDICVEIDMDKTQAATLQPGDRVELTFAADSDNETAMGTIEEILSIAENAAYRAYIVPDETGGLRIGQSVTVRTE